jgi:hypothetical protein
MRKDISLPCFLFVSFLFFFVDDGLLDMFCG